MRRSISANGYLINFLNFSHPPTFSLMLMDVQTLAQVIDIDTPDHYLSADSSTLNTRLKNNKNKGYC